MTLLRTVLMLVTLAALSTLGLAALVLALLPYRESWTFTLTVVGVPIAIICLVIGLPVQWMLRRVGRERAWHYAAAGAFVGLAWDFVVEFRTSGFGWSVTNLLAMAAVYAGMGAGCALIFWTLGVRRPRREAAAVISASSGRLNGRKE